jgi:hypothetical protein
MLYDSTDCPIYEQSVVRMIDSEHQFMVISIHNISMDGIYVSSILQVYSMSYAEANTLLYCYHPNLKRHVLLDKNGLEWVTV